MNDMTPPPVGHNRPPIVDPDLLVAEKKRVAEFADAAGAWLDLGKIETEEQASRLRDFIDGARGVVKAIDAARIEAKRPHDEAAKAVQDAFRPLLDTVERAIARTKPLLTAYLEEKRRVEEKRRADEAAAAREAAAAAEAAARAAEARHDVAGEAEAAAALDAAHAAEKAAQREVKVGVASATGGGRSAGLRAMKHAKVVNWNLAFIAVRDDTAVQDAITGALNRIIRAKDYDGHEIAGVEIFETRSVA